MRPFVTADEMNSIDVRTTKKLAISTFELMDRVAEEMAGIILARKGKILILCGPGNNGGDGYRVAQKLLQNGREVDVIEVLPAKSSDCNKAKQMYSGKYVSQISARVEIIVDAIFGNGGRADLPNSVTDVLKLANRSKAYRISLDVPTGVDTETGQVSRNVFSADRTLVVAYPKSVFMAESVAETLGAVGYVGDFFETPRGDFTFWALDKNDFVLPKLRRASHKGERGRCGIVGGAAGTPGAPFLAAEAAHRAGAGYVSVYFAKPGDLKIKIQDASFLIQMKWKNSDLKKENALVIGCGGVPRNFKYFEIGVPCVIDADALLDWKKLKSLRAECILTPHPGEAGRILKKTVGEIQKDRVGAVSKLVRQTGRAVYLKGAPGLLKFPDDDKCYVNLSINPIFSKAGSGDVLSGLLGGLLARFNAHSLVTGSNKRTGKAGFRDAIYAALLLQNAIGEVLRDASAAIASDQLTVVSAALKKLGVK